MAKIRVSVRPPPGAASEPPARPARAVLLRFGAPGAGCGRHLRAMQGAQRGRLDRRVHGAPWRRCARSISAGRSLASLRRVRSAPPLVCRAAGSSGSPCSWLGSSAPADRHRPRIRQGGMPAAWRIGRRPPGRCRPRPGRRRRCRFRSASWSPSPGRGRRFRAYTFQSGSIRSGSNGASDPCG